MPNLWAIGRVFHRAGLGRQRLHAHSGASCDAPEIFTSYRRNDIVSGGVGAVDRLDLEEVLQAEDAAFAAVAGLLEAAKGTAVSVRAAVDVHHAGPEPGGDALGAVGIAG